MNCFFETCDESVEHALKNKGFGVYYSESKNHNLNVHVHECCELFFCVNGGNTFLIDDKVYDMHGGDLFIMNQFEAHKVNPEGCDKFERFIMHVHPSFLFSKSSENTNLSDCFYSMNKVNKVSLLEEEKEYLISLFMSLKKNYKYADDMYKTLRATEILLETNRLFSMHNRQNSNTFSNKTVQLVVEYINNNYASDLTLEIIAKNAFVSVNQLCRIFNKYCSTTVTKYLISRRIAEAKKLLSQGVSVTDTAFMCGFNDYANFIKTFKKTVGVPPGKYKSNMRI